MKERPMLMTPENAQKCHDGTKTMTRRTVKPQPTGDVEWYGYHHSGREQDCGFYPMKGNPKDIDCWEQADGSKLVCPYGVGGDRLWFRETWCQDSRGGRMPNGQDAVFYRGSMPDQAIWQGFWKPAIHMPRWACRTVGEIVSVQVERLQEITEADAQAEGCENRHDVFHAAIQSSIDNVYRRNFAQLWESINGPGSWGLNPWVWVIEFKKVVA